MAGYIGSKTVNLSTTGADIAGDADVSGALDVGGGLTVDKDGSTVLTVDRATSDGTIIDLQKSGSSVGSIGAYNSATGIISGSAASYTGIYLNTNKIEPAGNNFGSEIRADNTVDVGSSSYRFKDLYLSGDIAHKDAAGNARLLYDKSANLLGNAGTYLYGFGVYLGGTGSANLLDDYEEGTWTPEVRISNSTVGITYDNRHGFYTKIGRVVHLNGTVTLTNKGSNTGSIFLHGQPFSIANLTDDTSLESGSQSVDWYSNSNGLYHLSLICHNASSGFSFYKKSTATANLSSSAVAADIGNTFSFRISMTYLTNA